MFSRQRLWRIAVFSRPLFWSVALFVLAPGVFFMVNAPATWGWALATGIYLALAWAMFEGGITAKERKAKHLQYTQESINRMEGQD
jgi:hypothetical protein